MQNKVKYPRNRETFGGWFGPYVQLMSSEALSLKIKTVSPASLSPADENI